MSRVAAHGYGRYRMLISVSALRGASRTLRRAANPTPSSHEPAVFACCFVFDATQSAFLLLEFTTMAVDIRTASFGFPSHESEQPPSPTKEKPLHLLRSQSSRLPRVRYCQKYQIASSFDAIGNRHHGSVAKCTANKFIDK